MSDTKPVHHLVDGDLEYKGFGEFISKNGLVEKGEDYSVVAVFGGQSSGKSTLLNKLFKTSFQEMDASSDRGQTTQGVWMSSAADTDRVVVLDFEGTDSAERGEDVSFEKKLSQFALALSDVLIINLFQNEIGRRNAMSIPLLENVIQINFDIQLQLAESTSARESKKMLMFVIRDYDGETPVKKLEQKLYSTMDGVWGRISKPEKYAEDDLTEWFDFTVAVLPHFKTDDFEGASGALRKQFLDSNDADYVFKTGDTTRKSGVQIEELDGYASSCWGAIKQNKDINIPGEKELVARHRSGEAARVLSDKVAEQVVELKAKLQSGEKVVGLHQMLDDIIAESLETFKKNTSQFSRYQDILDTQEASLKENLAEVVHTALEVVYERVCKDLEKNAKTALAEMTNKLKESQNFDTVPLWGTLRATVDNISETVVMPELAKLEAEGVVNAEGSRLCKVKMVEVLKNSLRDTLASKAASMSDLMASRFLFALLHNKDGLALNVKEDDLEKNCPDAYSEAMKVMDALLVWRYEDPMEAVKIVYPEFGKRDDGTVAIEGIVADEDLYLLPKEKLRDFFVRFCGEVKGKIMEARLGLKSQLQLPAWVYLTFALLGFDEAMWVVSNPVIIITIAALLYLFARKKVREAWIEGMENGPPALKVVLLAGWPYVTNLLTDDEPAEKSAAEKKND